MLRTTCPECGKAVEGTLAELTAHTKKCGKIRKSTLAADVLQRAAAVSRPSARPPLPVLPVTFFLTTPIPSQNTAGHSQQWFNYQKIRQQWRDIVRYEMPALVGLNLDWSRWHFLRLIPKRGKRYDHSNLVGGGKSMVDALTHHRVIRDDADQYFTADYDQERFEDWSQKASTGFTGIQTVITLLEAARGD